MAAGPVVAIVSPGEMGHAIGRVLVDRGARVITSLAGRSPRTHELTRAAGIEDVGSLDRLVREADLLLSVMPSASAPGVAQAVADRLASRDRPLTYVECNALAPQTARAIGEVVTAAGGQVVDVGIVGGPPTATSGPLFYASGPNIEAFQALAAYGLDIYPLGPAIGQASGMKMCYAALTKGLSALGTELLLAASALDLLDPLLDQFQSSQPVMQAWLERSIPGMPAKARRWVSEMEEIAATFDHLGLSPGYHQAAANLFEWVGATELGQERPEARDHGRTMRETIAALAASHARATTSGA